MLALHPAQLDELLMHLVCAHAAIMFKFQILIQPFQHITIVSQPQDSTNSEMLQLPYPPLLLYHF